MTVTVRPATDADWPAIWAIVEPVVRAGEAYTVDPGMGEAEAKDFWCGPPSTHVTVAEVDGRVLGTAHMGPNRAGPGAHIANASYMVAADAQGRGVGRALVVDSLERLAADGFAGLQFNAVAESNRGALKLYADLGFDIVGTIPGGFDHPREGRVGLHILYRPLP
ncbi:GNAT family N-acetyltransferase [Wenxinia marina]|uniref:Sortase n=1 Tax=Wenxinia marina DSM 24838 TaxID=1123501 RepID=A0A0D0Q944_9RHOB|nr:GNAT family N-acetyltransferase [Wenxinia marina]KIQ68897.1 Sortase [Wenxinia marina DSM 24838]GGL64359.1 acetyltransferase [Wenxinia marina]